MGQFSMEIYAPTGSNLSGNQHTEFSGVQLGDTDLDQHAPLSLWKEPCRCQCANGTAASDVLAREARLARGGKAVLVSRVQNLPHIGRVALCSSMAHFS
jgi:hypothetical protein